MLKFLCSTRVRTVVALSLFSFLPFSYAAQVVDINTADVATFAQNLNGIGVAKAQAIIDYRTANGRFDQVDDLVRVQGIGDKTVERLREYLVVNPLDAAPANSAPVAEPLVPAVSPN